MPETKFIRCADGLVFSESQREALIQKCGPFAFRQYWGLIKPGYIDKDWFRLHYFVDGFGDR